MVKNGWTWLDMTANRWNSWIWLEMSEIGLTWLECLEVSDMAEMTKHFWKLIVNGWNG